jgi:hypothetical protein
MTGPAAVHPAPRISMHRPTRQHPRRQRPPSTPPAHPSPYPRRHSVHPRRMPLRSTGPDVWASDRWRSAAAPEHWAGPQPGTHLPCVPPSAGRRQASRRTAGGRPALRQPGLSGPQAAPCLVACWTAMMVRAPCSLPVGVASVIAVAAAVPDQPPAEDSGLLPLVRYMRQLSRTSHPPNDWREWAGVSCPGYPIRQI